MSPLPPEVIPPEGNGGSANTSIESIVVGGLDTDFTREVAIQLTRPDYRHLVIFVTTDLDPLDLSGLNIHTYPSETPSVGQCLFNYKGYPFYPDYFTNEEGLLVTNMVGVPHDDTWVLHLTDDNDNTVTFTISDGVDTTDPINLNDARADFTIVQAAMESDLPRLSGNMSFSSPMAGSINIELDLVAIGEGFIALTVDDSDIIDGQAFFDNDGPGNPETIYLAIELPDGTLRFSDPIVIGGGA